MRIYSTLFSHFGRQKWWPASGGFKPAEWEICVGAILTQNTSWNNVEKALANLKKERIIAPEDIINIEIKKLEELIRPSGFFSQKTKRLKEFAKFVLSFENFEKFKEKVTREKLLAVKGIGPETADSILLYACGRPVFVVDAYAKRIFYRLGIIENNLNYEDIKNFFEKNLPRDTKLYNEFHALIVGHGKTICKKEPLCSQCTLEKMCEKRGVA